MSGLFYPVKYFFETRDLANPVARQRSNTNIRVVALGSDGPFKVPYTSIKCLYIFEFHLETRRIILK